MTRGGAPGPQRLSRVVFASVGGQSHNGVMTDVDEALLQARAQVLRDLHATGAADALSVSALEEVVAGRRWWVTEWDQAPVYVAGLVAQDLQDQLLESRGRWPLCQLCEDATHALYIHPDLGGPDPVWVCEESGQQVAPLGALNGAAAT
jgi:hypothetical protein